MVGLASMQMGVLMAALFSANDEILVTRDIADDVHDFVDHPEYNAAVGISSSRFE
jgi:hypothetical protein